MRGRGTSGEGREHAVHQHCVQPGSNRRGCERDALVDKETEFFAALNAALGIGRDDAPWQWALNSGNVGCEDRSSSHRQLVSRGENHERTADSVCSRKANARMRRHKSFQRIQQRGEGQGTLRRRSHQASKQPAAWRTTTQRNQGNHSTVEAVPGCHRSLPLHGRLREPVHS
ncbi:hypothetical protein ERJ75_001756300 [Trypanosoma vivax]|nr:hypothetical protein ERJ75_001756300 [Trypanosoma vivax]